MKRSLRRIGGFSHQPVRIHWFDKLADVNYARVVLLFGTLGLVALAVWDRLTHHIGL